MLSWTGDNVMQDSVDASLASQHSPADSRGEREATSYMHGELNKSRDKSVHEMMTMVIHVASHVSSEDDDAEQIFFLLLLPCVPFSSGYIC